MSDIEIPNPAVETQEEDAEAFFREREKEIEGRDETAAEKTGDSTIRISQNKMLGLPEKYTVGKDTFEFIAPPVGDMDELYTLIYQWPEVVLYAAISSEIGEPVDFDVVAKILTKAAEGSGKPAVTAKEVRNLYKVYSVLQVWELVPIAIQTALYVSAKGTTYEEMEPRIKRLTPSQMVDLLRAVFDCVGGYPGDTKDRF